MNSVVDQAVVFSCAQETLVGVLSLPEGNSADTAVVIVVGGPQYRVGSHRQFVLLARRLAAEGYAALRFDYRGMGDGSGAARDFLAVSQDIASAIDTVQSRLPHIRNVVLWGLCDAASAALLYMHETNDPRVAGLCLLNPWVRSEASLARTQVKHYYTERLMQREFWAKLVSGKVALSALSGLARSVRLSMAAVPAPNLEQQPFQNRMASAWLNFHGQILLLLSGSDYTAKEFLEFVGTDAAWSKAFAHSRLNRHDLPGADHTFSDIAYQTQVEKLTLDWIRAQTRIQNAMGLEKGEIA